MSEIIPQLTAGLLDIEELTRRACPTTNYLILSAYSLLLTTDY